MGTEPVLVACLCAEWCLSCMAYRDTFAAVAATQPQARFVWVDIEDHADALESDGHEAPDIVNFPTLLVLKGDAPLFFGTVLPHANVLERMLEPAKLATMPPLSEPVTSALGRAVRTLARTQPRAVAVSS
ncbi:MAG: thioredoxin family protein [Vitreoscilla sp.]|nr:thioredoxin family protein [Vitreoscilla sp.]MBP6676291.1 thioredoxin family protein [Vitreoscilla sp.]